MAQSSNSLTCRTMVKLNNLPGVKRTNRQKNKKHHKPRRDFFLGFLKPNAWLVIHKNPSLGEAGSVRKKHLFTQKNGHNSKRLTLCQGASPQGIKHLTTVFNNKNVSCSAQMQNCLLHFRAVKWMSTAGSIRRNKLA